MATKRKTFTAKQLEAIRLCLREAEMLTRSKADSERATGLMQAINKLAGTFPEEFAEEDDGELAAMLLVVRAQILEMAANARVIEVLEERAEKVFATSRRVLIINGLSHTLGLTYGLLRAHPLAGPTTPDPQPKLDTPE